MLCSFSGSAVRSHPFSIWSRCLQALLSWWASSEFFFYLFFFFPPLYPFVNESLHESLFTLSPRLGLDVRVRPWAGWEALDWLQAIPLPGLASRHCFCLLNRINKSMCQVDCSQETMTQFWHHWPPHLSPSPPPFASLKLLIKKTLLSWCYALPWGCLTALFSFLLQGIRGGSDGKNVRICFRAYRNACCACGI